VTTHCRPDIGPIWDGNEVWLVVAGAAIFAVFPSWYATMFSTFYLPLLIVLVALIGRGVSFEFRRKIGNARWQSLWKWSLTLGSLLVPLLLGTAFGDMLHGLPLDSAHNYTGNFVELLQPFGLYTGLTLTVLCLFLGATYLALKTEGALRERVSRLSGRLGWLAALITFGWLTWILALAHYRVRGKPGQLHSAPDSSPIRSRPWHSWQSSLQRCSLNPVPKAGHSPPPRPPSGVWSARSSSSSRNLRELT